MKATALNQGNRAFRNSQYEEALAHYGGAACRLGALHQSIQYNIYLCLKRLGANVDYHAFRQDIVSAQFSDWLEQPMQLLGGESLDEPPLSESRHNDLIATAFDESYYLATYPDLVAGLSGITPIEHYIGYGWKEGRRPNSWFDPLYYLDKYPEVKLLDSNPLLHYLLEGKDKGWQCQQVNFRSLCGAAASEIPVVDFCPVGEDFKSYEPRPIHPSLKLIAFYLPQFHPFPENDRWWGKGFTEWVNTTKAQPNYEGHYQPHLPMHFGFYDLRVADVLREQSKIALEYGIYGFNFYYYWFDGKVLMSKPFENLLADDTIRINFCLTWANENWTRRWDGMENDILIAQNHSTEDSTSLFRHLLKFFSDSRYITVDGKPVFIIYRPNIIPEMVQTIKLWRQLASEAGLPGLYLIGAQTFGFSDPNDYGFDASMEFPPHTVKSEGIAAQLNITNPNYSGSIYSYEDVVRNECFKINPLFKYFRTAMLSWDNTARKQNTSNTFHGFSIKRYYQWLSHIASWTHNNTQLSSQEKLVFVNAWNEWAEGTHLEPDRKYGFAYLEATRKVLSGFPLSIAEICSKRSRKLNTYAVIVHLHYPETWADISQALHSLTVDFDLYISCSIECAGAGIVDTIVSVYPSSVIRIYENRGRDILPFIRLYREIRLLGYTGILKLHGKKSAYRNDGANILDNLLRGLAQNPIVVENVCLAFASPNERRVGFYAPTKYIIKHSTKNMTYDQHLVDKLCNYLGFRFSPGSFPAGSMYWFKPESLSGLEIIEDSFFDLEDGLADGTLPHAIERIILNLVQHNGYTLMR